MMEQQIRFFASLTGLKKVEDVPIIILLNMTDILGQLITIRPISDYFEEYTGGANCFQACRFFANKFAISDQRVLGDLRIYGTCAVEENSFQGTLESLQNRSGRVKAAGLSTFEPKAPPHADEKISRHYEEGLSKPLYNSETQEDIAAVKEFREQARKRRTSKMDDGP